ELDITVENHGVISLEQRVQELVDVDGAFGRVTFREVVALEHSSNGVLRAELHDFEGRELAEPLGVVADHGAIFIEHLEGLNLIRLRGREDLLAAEGRPKLVTSSRIADKRGEIADEEYDFVAELLKLPHLLHQDRVAEVQVGAGRVEACLDA